MSWSKRLQQMILAGGVLLGGCDGTPASRSGPGTAGGGAAGGKGGTGDGAAGAGGQGGSDAAGVAGQGGTGGTLVSCANFIGDSCSCWANGDPQGIATCEEYMQCYRDGGMWVATEGAIPIGPATPGSCHVDGGAEANGDAVTDGGASSDDGSD